MKGRKVQITLSGMDGEWYRNAPIMTGRTGIDGVVVFEIKQSVPPRIDVGDLSGYPCWFPEYIATKEVFERGVVLHWRPSGIKKADKWCTPDSQAHEPQQKPGAVVLFVHPLNAWQNYWYTLLR
jgi:hypothetical protein